MIGKISLWRIEPCFKASKPECGEVSKVKKNVSDKNTASGMQQKTLNADTFTSSQKVNDNPNPSKVDSKKYTR